MPESDLVQTGIGGFDAILAGGIPRGNVILLEGAIGTGKTTMGVEFIYRGASQFDEPGIVVVFEVSPDKIIRDAQRFGWDLRALERTERLRIVFTTRDVLRQELQQADSVLLEEAAKLGARRIFVDGIARLMGSNGSPETRSGFHVFTEGLQREHPNVELVGEAGDGTEALAGGRRVVPGDPCCRDCDSPLIRTGALRAQGFQVSGPHSIAN
jgi:circadian clock protein KaiC